MKKFYLVDVSSMFFRAFYAIRPLTSPHGLPTNALFGFLSMTVKLLRDLHPDYIAFCYDRKEPSFRVDLYPEYKANRSEMPEDLVPQIPYVKKLTEALGIPQVEKEKFEADDVIGTLAKMGSAQGLEIVIVSSDKDFAQLIDSKVTMLDTMRDKHYDEEAALEKWGVPPEQMIDYLAIVGDASDNIPGVKGVGPKGAQKLLNEYRTLEGIYENLAAIKSASVRGKMESSKELAFLSRDLVTIRTEVDLSTNIEDYRLSPVKRDELGELLETLGFKSFEKGLLGKPSDSKKKAIKIKSDKTKEKAEPRKSSPNRALSNRKWVEEEWGIEDFKNKVKPYSELWVDLNERGLFFLIDNRLVSTTASLMEIGKVLSPKILAWYGFDLKEVWKVMGLTTATAAWDSLLAAYVIRSGQVGEFSKVYEEHLGFSFPDLPCLAQIFDCHLRLEQVLREKVTARNGYEVYEKIELPLIPILFQMEAKGILVDIDELKIQSDSLKEQISKVEGQIHELAGENFNVASPKQLGEILFNKLDLPKGKKTKTGFSTGADVLAKIVDLHPIVPLVVEFREWSKLVSTYLDSLPQLVDSDSGRLHTNFRQAVTSTGRLSSINPNLQNIPIRTEQGRKIRKAFVCPKGTKLISADYSQIELRILAHLTKDEGLVTAFLEDRDIHAATAAEVFGVPLDEVDSAQRRKAKAVNFGIAYGQGAFGLAEALGISRTEAKGIIEQYFVKFPGVQDYMTETIEFAKNKGYVETIFGRRRYIDELQSKNRNVQAFGERAAINAPMQGAASDIVKKAMIILFEDLSIPMLLQIHDELIFECPEDEVEDQASRIAELMESVVQLSVPLKVNISSGISWDEAH